MDNRNFRIMRKGYDRFEVDYTLQKQSEAIETLKQTNSNQNQTIETLTQDLASLQQAYDQLKSEISAKEKAVESMSRLALREANHIIDTAYDNADIIVREAMSSARQLLVEITRISNESRHMKDDLKLKLAQLYDVIEGLELPQAPKINIFDEE